MNDHTVCFLSDLGRKYLNVPTRSVFIPTDAVTLVLILQAILLLEHGQAHTNSQPQLKALPVPQRQPPPVFIINHLTTLWT